MARRSHRNIHDPNTLADRLLSCFWFCLDTILDVLCVVLMLLAIFALQKLVGFLFPVSPTHSVRALEIFHEVLLVGSGAMIAYRRLKSLVRDS